MSNSVFSLAIIQEELEAQLPVFYMSKALLDTEIRYPKMKKLILTLVVFARKLIPHYQAHQIIVITDIPLRYTLHSRDTSQQLISMDYFMSR